MQCLLLDIVALERNDSFTSNLANSRNATVLKEWKNMDKIFEDLIIVADSAICYSKLFCVRLIIHPVKCYKNNWSKINSYVKTSVQFLVFWSCGGDCTRAAQHTTTFHAEALTLGNMTVKWV